MRDRPELNRVLDNIERALKTGRKIEVKLEDLNRLEPPDTRRPIWNLKQKTREAEERIARAAERRAFLGLEAPPAPPHQQPMSVAGADPEHVMVSAPEPAALTRYQRLKAEGGFPYHEYMARARIRAAAYHARRRAARLS